MWCLAGKDLTLVLITGEDGSEVHAACDSEEGKIWYQGPESCAGWTRQLFNYRHTCTRAYICISVHPPTLDLSTIGLTV